MQCTIVAMKWVMTAVVAGALAAGCDGNGGGGAGGGALEGTAWRLAAWSASSPDPAQFTITADFSTSQMSGTSAVNSYGGPYTSGTDGDFSVGDLSATAMAGSEDAMRAESLYFDLLRQARTYETTGSTLTLKDGSHQDLLIFHAR